MKAMFIRGIPALAETVFYDSDSKTLIVTDLMFNMDSTVAFGTRLLLSAFGANNKLAQSKLVRMNTKDKSAYKSSAEKLLDLDFARVIVSHGNLVEDAQAFKVALSKTL